MEFAVTCPSCGKEFTTLLKSDTFFCVNCGKKLAIGIEAYCMLYDDRSQQTRAVPKFDTSGTYSERTYASTEGPYVQTAAVTLRLPGNCVPSKGKFSYFGIKWDGRDFANAGLNENVTVPTTVGDHTLEIRQVCTMLTGIKVTKSEIPINVTGDMNISISANSYGFILN